MAEKITSFEQLIAWQKSIELAAELYEKTRTFPASEQFGITNQMRRAVPSISANIAEGFGRRSSKDKLHFYTIAYGSLLEVKSFLYLAKKLDYLAFSDDLKEQVVDLQKLLNALTKSTKATV